MSKEPKYKHELYEKLKTLSPEELHVYRRSATLINRLIGVVAVFFILGSLLASSVIGMIAVGFFVYVLGNLSVGVGYTLAAVREQIAKSEKT